MAHRYSNRPSFVGLDDGMFAFAEGVPPTPKQRQRIREIAGSLAPQDERADLWGAVAPMWRETITTLATGTDGHVDEIVTNLFATPLVHGFGPGHIVSPVLRSGPEARLNFEAMIVDRFFRLAEAVGAARVKSAEHGQETIELDSLDSVFARIEQRIGADLTPPAQCGGVFGLKLAKGIFSDRHLDGIYVAWRLREIVRRSKWWRPKIAEIGGGAGFVAHYARTFGLDDFTIIDLPTVSMVQYIVLSTSFPDQVAYGERMRRGISLLAAGDQPDLSRFNLIVNVDSFPEMPPHMAEAYIRAIGRRRLFLSINQESGIANGDASQNVVAEIAERMGLRRQQRFPAWMRTGYVEELFG